MSDPERWYCSVCRAPFYDVGQGDHVHQPPRKRRFGEGASGINWFVLGLCFILAVMASTFILPLAVKLGQIP